MTISLLVCVLAWLLLPLTAQASGADEIFQLVGQDKPASWDTWNRETKFQYLQNMGLYPPDGHPKYQGKVGDLTGYFEWLGIEQPKNWLNLSFDERRAIVRAASQAPDAITEPTPAGQPMTVVDNQKPPSNFAWKMVLTIVGLLLGGLIIWASYKVDWLRANRPK